MHSRGSCGVGGHAEGRNGLGVRTPSPGRVGGEGLPAHLATWSLTCSLSSPLCIPLATNEAASGMVTAACCRCFSSPPLSVGFPLEVSQNRLSGVPGSRGWTEVGRRMMGTQGPQRAHPWALCDGRGKAAEVQVLLGMEQCSP